MGPGKFAVAAEGSEAAAKTRAHWVRKMALPDKWGSGKHLILRAV